jgi:nucleoside-diphosphate-sugar epimerase
VGYGDIGERVARRLAGPWRALALRRRATAVPPGVRGIAVDLTQADTLTRLEELAPDALLVTLSPGERSAEGYRRGFTEAMTHIVAGLGAHRPSRAFFISSTRVYAETGGAWVDESGPLAMDSDQARAIIDAENTFLEGLPGSVVLRAGGLYGHGPGPLLRAVAAGRLRPREPVVFGNRIHRDDVAAFIVRALEHPPVERIVNLCDDGVVPLQEVEAWLCDQLRRSYDPPHAEPAGAAPSHKRIRNDRLHETGYELQYPDYRSGYELVLRQWMEHSDREDGLDLH